MQFSLWSEYLICRTTPQAVRLVALEDVLVQPQSGLEFGELEIRAQPEDAHALPDRIQCSLLIQLSPDALEKMAFRLGTVFALQGFPYTRESLLDPCGEVWCVESQLSIVVLGCWMLIDPAVLPRCWQISSSKAFSRWILMLWPPSVRGL